MLRAQPALLTFVATAKLGGGRNHRLRIKRPYARAAIACAKLLRRRDAADSIEAVI